MAVILLAGPFNTFSVAQDLKILGKAEKAFPKIKQNSEFAFIDPSVDTSNLQFVAAIEASFSDRSAGIEPLYIAIRRKAKQLGANSFIPKFFTRNDKLHSIDLILNTYFASDSILAINQSSKPVNSIFLFGGEKGDTEDTIQTFKLNDKVYALTENYFFEYGMSENESISICKPGFESMKRKISWNPGTPSTYLMLSGGYSVSDFKPTFSNNLARIAGFIADIDKNFGELLRLLYTEVRFATR